VLLIKRNVKQDSLFSYICFVTGNKIVMFCNARLWSSAILISFPGVLINMSHDLYAFCSVRDRVSSTLFRIRNDDNGDERQR
jgi:hypothetical protein